MLTNVWVIKIPFFRLQLVTPRTAVSQPSPESAILCCVCNNGQLDRMRWIRLIRTSKLNVFPAFQEECERKTVRLSGKVLLRCLHLIWAHTSDSFSRPWEFTTWRKWFTCPNPPSCLIPRGVGAEAGAMLGYQSVFLPFFPLLFFPFFRSSA